MMLTAPKLLQPLVLIARSQLALIGLYSCSILFVAFWIEASGGLPSQYAHLYYVPVVLSALTLPRWPGLGIAIMASLAVSPAIDLFHLAFGLQAYFPSASPWTVTPDGWIVRPLAFLAISVLGHRLGRARSATITATAAAETKNEELGVLGKIDKLILSGADEDQAIHEITRLVSELTSAKVAGIVTPVGKRQQTVRGFTRDGAASRFVNRTNLPYGEGVSGWALLHGRTATTRNALADSRYDAIREVARGLNQRATAATPIILDGVILGALMIGYEEEKEFSAVELATLERLANQAAIAVANARQRQALRDLALGTATALADVIESRDPYTGDHSSRLVQYSGLIAGSLELSARETEIIRLGAALHDVGKIIVPDYVLKKADKLTPDDFAIMRQHSYVGGQICKKVPFFADIYPIVYHHHENFGGGGYPDGISGERIPFGARIVAVADAYDAMTSDRIYRSALGHSRAIEILRRDDAQQWDPKVVSALLSALPEDGFPRQAAA